MKQDYCDGISNRRQMDYLFHSLSMTPPKKSRLRIINPVGGFHAWPVDPHSGRDMYVENVSVTYIEALAI